MLINYGFQNRKNRDNYDRRKKEGTTRSSDIWSIGCLFYELLTGQFLFPEIDEDYFGFTAKLNSSNFSEIFTEEKKLLLNNNTYLIDFLKFVMICDQKYRPNIDKIIERYEHFHAILNNLNIFNNPCINLMPKRNLNEISRMNTFNYNLNSGDDSFCANLIDQYLENMQDLLTQKNYLNCEGKEEKNNSNFLISKNKSHILINENENNFIERENVSQYFPGIFKVTKDVYLCDYHFFEFEYENNPNRFCDIGITHIISWRKTNDKKLPERIEFLNIFENLNDSKRSIFFHIFKVMDFIRYCITHKGILCFIDDFRYQMVSEKQNFLMRNIIILCFSYFMKLQAYDIWTYLNSKLLFFTIDMNEMVNISNWISYQNSLENWLINIPTFKCLCGACNIYLKVEHNLKSSKAFSCVCSKKYENIENTKCPSNGCYDYIQDMKVIN